ncbi:MAG: hypothetical protein WC957_02065 [Candidatus Neomarinimicrobiota bacterium]|jgi:CBS domain containing-hemolysin-like protein
MSAESEKFKYAVRKSFWSILIEISALALIGFVIAAMFPKLYFLGYPFAILLFLAPVLVFGFAAWIAWKDL